MSLWQHLTRPLLSTNPVSVQILGLCSALAVSSALLPALIMSASVISVLALASVIISLLRHVLPDSIRLVLEVTIIASLVIVTDEVLKTWAPQSAEYLSVFVSLIVTNCIILGRTESFALHNPPLASLADAIGNGLGYSLVLVSIAAVRELAGSGSLLGAEVLPLITTGGWYRPNEMMQYAPSAFFLLGFLIWGLKRLSRTSNQNLAGNTAPASPLVLRNPGEDRSTRP